MDDRTDDLRTAHTGELGADTLGAARALLYDVFDDMTGPDREHGLGDPRAGPPAYEVVALGATEDDDDAVHVRPLATAVDLSAGSPATGGTARSGEATGGYCLGW